MKIANFTSLRKSMLCTVIVAFFLQTTFVSRKAYAGWGSVLGFVGAAVGGFLVGKAVGGSGGGGGGDYDDDGGNDDGGGDYGGGGGGGGSGSYQTNSVVDLHNILLSELFDYNDRIFDAAKEQKALLISQKLPLVRDGQFICTGYCGNLDLQTGRITMDAKLAYGGSEGSTFSSLSKQCKAGDVLMDSMRLTQTKRGNLIQVFLAATVDDNCDTK